MQLRLLLLVRRRAIAVLQHQTTVDSPLASGSLLRPLPKGNCNNTRLGMCEGVAAAP